MSLDNNDANNDMYIEEIDKLRIKIDETDSLILNLLEKRMGISEEVGALKEKYNKKIFDSKREDAVIKNRCEKLNNKKFTNGIEEIFYSIFKTSRDLQQKHIVSRKNIKIDGENIKVSFQGVIGGYGHEVSCNVFGDSSCLTPKKHFEDVLLSIYENESTYGVLPIENSFTGTINNVLDILVDYDAKIVGEAYLSIDHALLGIKGTSLNNIKEVMSHEEALKQCSKYIKEKSFGEKITTNTALAAKYISETGDGSLGAICSKNNSVIYNLDILDTGITNMKGNQTRFIIVQSKNVAKSVGNKLSIRCNLPHEKSALIKALLPIYNSEINLTSIVSRPNRDNAWQYYFYIDMTANWDDKNVIECFNNFKSNVYNINILGRYDEGLTLANNKISE